MQKFINILIFVSLTYSALAKSPHGEKFNIDCAKCHNADSWTKLRPDNQFDHSTTKYALTGQHKNVACMQCHKTLDFKVEKQECFDCHTDVHQGTTGRDCERCHTTKSWIVTTTKQLHIEAGFPLRGSHETADCNRCHKSASEFRFNNLNTDCYACHRDKYYATQGKPMDHLALGFDTDCARCHNMSGLDWNSVGKGFDHSFFPLTGSHNTDCVRCHTDGNYKKRLSSDCTTCHNGNRADATATIPAHAGAFAKFTCVDCHNTTAWNILKLKQHDSWFPIYSGKHAGTWTKCTECHTNNSSFKSTCITCHEHSKARMDDEHDEVGGYVYNSANCIACHPRGTKE